MTMPHFQLPFRRQRTILKLRAREMKAYWADVRGRRPANARPNVLIFGQGRSGTTLFEHLMVSTGHFHGHHEVLNTVTREVTWPVRYVRGLGRSDASKGIVVHVKPEHLGRARKHPVATREFIGSLVDDGWLIVHIQRRDILRQMLSKLIAKARGAYHKVDDRTEDVRLRLSVRDFIEDYERRRGLVAEEFAQLADLPHFSLYYEDHLENPELQQETINRLLAHLGLELKPVTTQLRKIASSSPEDYVENLGEIKEAFRLKGWQWTL